MSYVAHGGDREGMGAMEDMMEIGKAMGVIEDMVEIRRIGELWRTWRR